MNVADVLFVVVVIPYAMIAEPTLPHLQIGTEYLFRAIRKSTFYKLNRSFQRYSWRQKRVKVIGHQDKFVQKISPFSIIKKRANKELRPVLVPKQLATLPSHGRDHIRLT